MSSQALALCSQDAASLRALLPASAYDDAGVGVLLPPLQDTVVALSERYHRCSSSRTTAAVAPLPATFTATRPGLTQQRFLTCCVRLAPEKNAALFADLVELLAPTLQQLDITPLLCGAGGDAALAASVRARVAAAVPGAVVVTSFLTPAQLACVWTRTVLNIHPPLHDAFGMTVAEAASYGVPSVVHVPRHAGTDNATCGISVAPGGKWSPSVGVLELLQPRQGMVVPVDLRQERQAIASSVACVLRSVVLDHSNGTSHSHHSSIGCRARRAARGWTTAAAGRKLMNMVGQHASSRIGV